MESIQFKNWPFDQNRHIQTKTHHCITYRVYFMSWITWRLSLMETNMLPTVNVFNLSTLTSCDNQTLIYITSVAGYSSPLGRNRYTSPTHRGLTWLSNVMSPFTITCYCATGYLFLSLAKNILLCYSIPIRYFSPCFMSCTLIIVHLFTTLYRL